MNPGQVSDALAVKLKQIGSRITDEQIAAAWTHTEKARVDFCTAAVAFGALLLAKKASLGHGKWLPWCEKFGGKLAKQIGRALPIWQEVAPRTLRQYTYIAQHFLADVEQGSFTGEIQDHRPKLEGITPDDVLALDRLTAKERQEVFARIEEFVAGRSLQTMLSDFRRAENAAADEAAEHEAAAKKSKRGSGTGPGADDPQLHFEEMLSHVSAVDNLIESKQFVGRTNAEFWNNLAAKLQTQADRARQLAKEVGQ